MGGIEATQMWARVYANALARSTRNGLGSAKRAIRLSRATVAKLFIKRFCIAQQCSSMRNIRLFVVASGLPSLVAALACDGPPPGER